jgi:alpha-N-arabinofuranosidase
MRDAVFTAMSFHMFHRHAEDLVMTNMAQTVNVLQALVLTEGPRLCVTPTYWVYDLFKPHRGGQVVPLSLDGPAHTLADGRTVPLTSASASVQDGVLTLSLVNAALEDSAAVTITVDGGVPGEVLEAQVLTAAQVRDHNTPENPAVIAPAPLVVRVEGDQLTLSLPPHAIGVVRCRFTAAS